MNSRNFALCICTAAALIYAPNACAQALAKGKDVAVDVRDVQAIGNMLALAERATSLGDADKILKITEDLLIYRGLAAQAKAAGLNQDPSVTARVAQAIDRVLAEARLAQIDAAATPKPDDLSRYALDAYRSNPERYQSSTQFNVRHILLNGSDAEARARALHARLLAGEAFDKLAREHSADKNSAGKGGELGWISADNTIREFSQAVRRLTAGQLAEPFQTRAGWHLVRVDERKEAAPKPFADVKAALEAETLDKLKLDARKRVIQPLLENVEVDRAAVDQLAKTYAAKP